MQLRKSTDIKLIQKIMNYKVNKDKSFIEKGGGAGNKALPDYSKGYGVPQKGVTTLADEEVKSETTSNPDGTFTITKSKNDQSNSTTYKKEKDSNVYVNENGQKRTFNKIDKKDPKKDDPAMNIDRASQEGA